MRSEQRSNQSQIKERRDTLEPHKQEHRRLADEEGSAAGISSAYQSPLTKPGRKQSNATHNQGGSLRIGDPQGEPQSPSLQREQYIGSKGMPDIEEEAAPKTRQPTTAIDLNKHNVESSNLLHSSSESQGMAGKSHLKSNATLVADKPIATANQSENPPDV